MNLTERTKKIGERLECPMCPDIPCMGPPCAHYNPETDECFHVEAARAQAQAAKALVGIAEWVKQTFDSPLEQKRVITLDRSIEPEYEEFCGPFWTCPACGSEFILPDSRYCPDCGRAIEWVGDWVGDTDD